MVSSVAISLDNRLVATGLWNDNGVLVWDIKTGQLVQRLRGLDSHKLGVCSVAFSSNGKQLVGGSRDASIKMWELSAAWGQSSPEGTSIRRIQTFEGHTVCYVFFQSRIMLMLIIQ